MQAIILAAGKSTRTHPLTLTRPKPLLKAANKTLLEHNLDSLSGIIDGAVIVVGYKKEMIKKLIGKSYNGIRIKYKEQGQQLGTAHALGMCSGLIKGKFILLMGDDLYSKDDLKKCSVEQYSILVSKTDNPKNFGIVVEKNGIMQDFVEKPEKFVSDLASTACYSLDRKIFNFIGRIKKSKRGEYELPDAIKMLSGKEKIKCIKTSKWLPIANPWDLLMADRILRGGKNFIGKSSKVAGKVSNSAIGDNCTIYGNVSGSIIMDGTLIEKGSFVESSVIGFNVRFGGKIKSLEHGAVIADNVVAGNVEIMPGCMIWPGKHLSNTTVKGDIK